MTGIDQVPQETELTARQSTFIAAMLSAPSITTAARIAGIGEKTARRWLKLPHIYQAYQDAQKEVFDAALTTLKLAIPDAVSTLARHMKAEDTPASSQIRSAQILLEQSLSLFKMTELEQKIADLESKITK